MRFNKGTLYRSSRFLQTQSSWSSTKHDSIFSPTFPFNMRTRMRGHATQASVARAVLFHTNLMFHVRYDSTRLLFQMPSFPHEIKFDYKSYASFFLVRPMRHNFTCVACIPPGHQSIPPALPFHGCACPAFQHVHSTCSYVPQHASFSSSTQAHQFVRMQSQERNPPFEKVQLY